MEGEEILFESWPQIYSTCPTIHTTLLPYFLIIAGNGCLTLLICSPRFTYPNTIVLFYLSENDISFHLLYHIFLHIDSNIDT